MSENELTTTTTEETQPTDTELFDKVRQFDITLEDGTVRKAMIRLLTPEEALEAEEYALAVIAEKAKGTVNPITGKTIILPTRDNMMEDAKLKGLWTDEDEIEFSTLESLLRKKLDELEAGKIKKSRAYQLALEIIQHRKDLLPYYRMRYNIYEKTAEAAGENALNKYMCVVSAIWHDTGEPIFTDLKAFDRGGSVRRQVYEFWMFLQRFQNEYSAPVGTEIAFLRKFKYLDSEGNLYDMDKQEVVMNLYDKVEEEDEWTFYEEDGSIAVPEDDTPNQPETPETSEEPEEESVFG